MNDNNFKNKIAVSKEKLIPIDPLEKCLWAMEATGKISYFGLITRRNLDKEQLYGNHYWVVNHELGDLEYKLRESKIDKKEFENGCNIIYDKYNVNFDMLRDQLADLETLEQEHTPKDEATLSTKFNTQTTEYLYRMEKQKLMEQENSLQHEDNLENET